MSYEWFISLRYLKAKRRQTFISLITWISVGGVAVGVTALIVVLAVMTGAQEDIRKKILGANSHITISPAVDAGIGDVSSLLDRVERAPGVVAASPFVMNQVMLTSRTKVSGVVLRGVDVERSLKSSDLGGYMVRGEVARLGGEHIRVTIEPDDLGIEVEKRRPGIILGSELAYNLRVDMGDVVTVVSPAGHVTPVGAAPVSREFYVAGIFRSGMYEYDSALALISLSQAQSLFNMGDRVSGVEVRVEDVFGASDVAERLQEMLGYRYVVKDWKELNQNLFFALELEKTALGVILALIICVAAFNIVSTLIMVVMEKSREIAILKAMGAPRGSIMRIFLLEGLIIGLAGIIIGDIGGVILCELLERYHFIRLPQDVYNLETLPVKMRLADIVTVSGAALMITVLAAIYPSWSASRLDPVEALRYE